MKKIILLLLTIGLSVLVFAQSDLDINPNANTEPVDDEAGKMNRFFNASGAGRLYVFHKRPVEIEGNPYLTEGPLMGNITTKNNVFLNTTLFKYNTNEDCIEMMKEGRAINIFAHQVKSFNFFDVVENRKRTFRNGFHNYADNYTSLSYYEVLYDGDVKLLRKFDNPVLRVKSNINVPGMNTNSATKKYVSLKRLYLKEGDKFIPVKKLTASSLKKALKSPEFNANLKATKNKCRNLEQIQEALKYYDTLETQTSDSK